MVPLLSRQHGVLRRDQATEAGIQSPGNRPAATRVLPNVYSVIPPPLTAEARWWAAALFGGQDAALAARSAAEVFGWIAPDAHRPVRLLVPHDRQVSSAGFVVVSRTRVPLWTTVRGLPVTEPARTMVSLGSMMGLRELTAITAKAVQRRDLRLTDILDLTHRHPKLPGAARAMRAAQSLAGGSESLPELELALFLQRCGLAEPLRQVDIFDGRELVTIADVMWLCPLVAGYYDGRTHLDYETQDGDSVRTLRIKALGVEPVRVTAGAMRRPTVVREAFLQAHRLATAAALPPSPRLRLRHRGAWVDLAALGGSTNAAVNGSTR